MVSEAASLSDGTPAHPNRAVRIPSTIPHPPSNTQHPPRTAGCPTSPRPTPHPMRHTTDTDYSLGMKRGGSSQYGDGDGTFWDRWLVEVGVKQHLFAVSAIGPRPERPALPTKQPTTNPPPKPPTPTHHPTRMAQRLAQVRQAMCKAPQRMRQSRRLKSRGTGTRKTGKAT